MSEGSPRDEAAAEGDAIRLHPQRRVDCVEDRTAAQHGFIETAPERWT